MLGRLFAVLAFALLLAAPSAAHASEGMPRLTIDWGKLFARSEWSALYKAPGQLPVPSAEASRVRVIDEETSAWLGSSIGLAVVARDWQGAQRLLGSHLCATDALRVARSSRMVVGRVGLRGGRVMPFAQIGLGQWRLDPELLPYFPHETEMAAQLGMGFEITLSHRASLAFEADHTVLYREAHESHVASPHVWGGFAVARVEL